MLKQPFINAAPIMKLLEQKGFESYLVGGAVRDYLSDRQPGDVDIATNATPKEIQKIFPKTVPVGIEHGTILVLHNGEAFEVTTYRTEGEYKDYRHPSEVSFVKDIKLDLSRRDFTINAIAMDIKGNLLDPFNGKRDLNQEIIRTVGSPHERFTEDPLRMLRGVRFISQLNFNMDSNTKEAINDLHHLLEKISVERITDEITKLFIHYHINSALDIIGQTNMDQSLPIFNINNHLFSRLKAIQFEKPVYDASIIFALFHLLDSDISVQEWIKTYKASNHIKRKVLHLIENYNLYQSHGLNEWLLYNIGEQLNDLVQLINLIDAKKLPLEDLLQRYNRLPIKSRNDIVISGQDLLQWFPNEKRGKWVGNILSEIEKSIVLGKLKNNRDEIESRVKEWKAQGRG